MSHTVWNMSYRTLNGWKVDRWSFLSGPSSTSVDPSREASLTSDRRAGSSRRLVDEGAYVPLPCRVGREIIGLTSCCSSYPTVEGIQDQVYPQVNELIRTRETKQRRGDRDTSSWTMTKSKGNDDIPRKARPGRQGSLLSSLDWFLREWDGSLVSFRDVVPPCIRSIMGGSRGRAV